MKAKTFKIVCFAVAGVLLALLIALSAVVGAFASVLDKFVVGYKQSSNADTEANRASGAELSEQIQAEGTVLVKNEDNNTNKPLLPLSVAEAPKVNVFGWASVDWVVSGSGSGQVKGSKTVKFLDALEDAGIEYNHTLTEDVYLKFGPHRDASQNGGGINDAQSNAGSLKSFNYDFSRLYEPKLSDYPAGVLDEAMQFSETAFVVLGRVSGESNDSPKVQYKMNSASDKPNIANTGLNAVSTIDEERTYLEISTEEEELLEYVGANYKNVVVLINSTNVMELGFLDTIDGLDACLVVATTGTAGAKAIPKLIYSDLEGGSYTPSGKLADTYAYDLSTSSTYVDTGSGNQTTNFYTNGAGLYPTTVSHTNGSSNEPYAGVAYQDYRESIYMGYKWYETADEMGFWNSSYAKNKWGINGYDDVVQYPFGFGLSYATFSWEILTLDCINNDDVSGLNGSTVTASDTIQIGVRVTNTQPSGGYSGQDVVELYYTAPYTKNGIEKSSVNLLAFAKTQTVLAPGQYEDVVLEFDVSDMASYDYSEIKVSGGGYILEQGNYSLTFRTDAHNLAGKKIVGSGLHGSDTLTYRIAEDTLVDEDAQNRFTGENTTDGVAIDGNSDGSADITYLTRANFEGTFPEELSDPREMTDEIKALNLYTSADAAAWDAAHDTGAVTFGNGSDKMLVYEDGEINELGMKLGLNFDDEGWDALLDVITKAEMQNLVLHGYTATRAINSIGKPETLDLDGPNQIGSFVGEDTVSAAAVGFSSIVLAQSWNAQLAYSMGLEFGNQCLDNKVMGWYGPGVNLHRSPFGGRNYEYYSEDTLISGVMCANVVKAAKNKGVFCYLKHICLYEGESGRDGMYTWLTEQALRELYLKPFEIAVKEGGSSAIMTSYGRIGAVWTGGSEALLTEVVRGEWGFQGAFLTDYADHQNFMNGDQMLRAGGDLWMDGWLDDGKFVCATDTNAYNQTLRNATKNIVYMWLNALATNAQYNTAIANGEISDKIMIPSLPELNFRWYIPVLVVVDVLLAAGAGVLIFFGIKKKDKPVAEAAQSSAPDSPEPTADDTPNE